MRLGWCPAGVERVAEDGGSDVIGVGSVLKKKSKEYE